MFPLWCGSDENRWVIRFSKPGDKFIDLVNFRDVNEGNGSGVFHNIFDFTVTRVSKNRSRGKNDITVGTHGQLSRRPRKTRISVNPM
jgi:hypothetical protein